MRTARWPSGGKSAITRWPLAATKAADVLIPDGTLSRRHFLIWREGESFLIKDLGSQNGTWVDGQRAQGTKLSHNVCIVAGRTVFMFCEHRLHAGAAALRHRNRFFPAALAGVQRRPLGVKPCRIRARG